MTFDEGGARAFDRLAALAAHVLSAPIAVITLAHDDDFHVVSSFGADPAILTGSAAFPAETIVQADPLVICDTSNDARFAGHTLVTGSPGLRFYGGIALVNGASAPIGTIGVFDVVPRTGIRHQDLAGMRDLAALAVALFDLRPRHATRAKTLAAKQDQLLLNGSLHMLFEANPLPMWVHDHRTLELLLVNDAAIEFFGWSRDTFLAMTLRDLRSAETWRDSQSDLSASLPISDQPVWTLRRADSPPVSVRGATRPCPWAGEHAVLNVCWDVTEASAAREDLKASLESLRNVSEQLLAARDELAEANRLAQLGTWRLSFDLRRMTWSNEIYTLIGRTRSEFLPSVRNALSVIHSEDRALFARAMRTAVVNGDTKPVETRIIRADGRLRHVRIAIRRDDRATEDRALFGYVQDMSDRWETQQALMRSERLAILGHLTGGVAHDFNNLLTIITLNLEEAIAELPEDDPLQAILVPALQATHRGAELTNQLLTYARQAPLRPQPFSLASFLGQFNPLLRRALGKKHRLTLLVDDEDCTPLVDPSQLQTAILNIALNARDAMPEGGEVTIKATSVTLPSAEFPVDDLAAGVYAMITISDHGCGIPPDVLPHIFEPFYSTKESASGSGLGLSMVDGFIGQSGGRTLVETELGRGTTIRLILPLISEQKAETKPTARGLTRRALVVEDQPAVLATVKRMFTQLGYDVCALTNADEALAQLEHDDQFDILFTDIVLPGGRDGIVLAREVRRRIPSLPILLTSGFSEYNRSAPVLPGIEVLKKPYKRQDLLDRLKALTR